jgi:hypothetical protein
MFFRAWARSKPEKVVRNRQLACQSGIKQKKFGS